MVKKNHHFSYYFDFSSKISKKLPLSQKNLKICKQEILRLNSEGIYGNSLSSKINFNVDSVALNNSVLNNSNRSEERRVGKEC